MFHISYIENPSFGKVGITMESDEKKNLIGKKVKIFFDRFKYEGVLLFEDEQIYQIDDVREGIINLPRANSALKEIKDGGQK